MKIAKILIVLMLLILPCAAFAEPYLAVREGLKCSSCHVNRTGGGKRTRMGTGYGVDALPAHKVDLQEKKIPAYWSVLDGRVSFGGDFRFENVTNFVEDDTTNTFETDKANLYGQVALLPDTLFFYIDESVAPGGAQARELSAVFEGLPAYGWFKAGKLLPAYGLRLEDDQAYTREVTGFNFNNPDLGVEAGFEPSNWTFTIAATNGTSGSLDNNTAKQIIGSAAYVKDLFRIGASGSYNSGDTGVKNSAALWGGLRWGHAVALAEVDIVHEGPEGQRSRDQFVSYSEINYRVCDGLTIKAAYEYFDPDTEIAENQRDRVLIGAEFFPLPFVHLSAAYRFNQSIPQNIPQNADQLSFRLHLYF